LPEREIRDIVYEGRYWAMRKERTPTKPLPQALEQVAQQARNVKVSLHDPQTGDPYDYRVIDERHFELCAVFALPRQRSRDVAWNPFGRPALLPIRCARDRSRARPPTNEAFELHLT
jgi:hypothetical protein